VWIRLNFDTQFRTKATQAEAHVARPRARHSVMPAAPVEPPMVASTGIAGVVIGRVAIMMNGFVTICLMMGAINTIGREEARVSAFFTTCAHHLKRLPIGA